MRVEQWSATHTRMQVQVKPFSLYVKKGTLENRTKKEWA